MLERVMDRNLAETIALAKECAEEIKLMANHIELEPRQFTPTDVAKKFRSTSEILLAFARLLSKAEVA
jgi:hypothetical protein